MGRLHRGDEIVAGAGIALDRAEADRQQLTGIVALHRVNIGVASGRLLVRRAERGILRDVESVAIMQGGLQADRRLALGR